MSHEPVTIRLASPLVARFAAETTVELKAAEGEVKRPSFSMVAYTGAPVVVGGFYAPVVLDLSGMRVASQEIPILFAHDMERIVGQSDSVKIDGTGVRLTGVVTGDNADAAEVTSQARNGFKWRASVGASVLRREFVEAGKKVTVNGRELSGPIIVSRETELLEVSFVAIGADNATSAAVAASRSLGNPSGDNPMGFDEWLKAKGFDPAALSDTQTASLRLAYDAEHKTTATAASTATTATTAAPSTPPVDAFSQMMADTRANLERQSRINDIAARWIADRPGQIDEIERITKAALASPKTDADQFELALMRDLRANAGMVISSRSGGADRLGPKILEAAVCMSGRLPDLESHFDERTLQLAHDQYPHGIGLCEVMLVVARQNGYTGLSASDLRSLLRYAFAPNLRANAGFSTLDIAGILSSSANKFIRPAFEAVESAWKMIAGVRNLRDFKTHTTYSLTGDLMYEKVGAGGEIPHGTLGDESYTLRADTYGKMLAITRKDLINDDLGALTRVPTRLGRGAALKINDVFWTEFLADVATFYTTGRGNYFEGAATNLQSSSLKTAVEKFRRQTDPDGKPLGVSPRFLVVPPELEITADELMTSTFVNTGGAATTEKVPNRNVWSGKFDVVMSTYLSNSSYTGYSTTAWYLLADPRDLPVIEIGFLNGRDMPVIDSADADFDTLGIQMRGYHDFGVAKQEYRAGVRSKGTS